MVVHRPRLLYGFMVTMSESLVGVDGELITDVRRVEAALAGQVLEAQQLAL
jgi:hypothetical protein